MKRTICYLCALVMIFVTFAVPVVAAARTYTDVADGAWYSEAVEYVTEKGLMNGTGDGLFAPDDTTNRGMIATILWRHGGQPAYEFDGTYFLDLECDKWYSTAAIWAHEMHIMFGIPIPCEPGFEYVPTGFTVTFEAEQVLTREQLATTLFRYAKILEADATKSDTLESFADRDQVSAWAREAMGWCVANGIIKGMEENGQMILAPQGSATRAQLAATIMRFAKLVDPLHNCNVLYVDADCGFTITNAKGETLTFSPEAGRYDGTMYCYGMDFSVPDVIWMFCVNYSESFTIEAEEGGVIASFYATKDSETIIK